MSCILEKRAGVSTLLFCVFALLTVLERLLAQNERPADIVCRMLEQAGYDIPDSLELLGGEGLSFILRFYYKSQVLGAVVRLSLSILYILTHVFSGGRHQNPQLHKCRPLRSQPLHNSRLPTCPRSSNLRVNPLPQPDA